ncbi:MAG: hypothetical protein ACE365_05465 [Gammaproteobacteria bacterium]
MNEQLLKKLEIQLKQLLEQNQSYKQTNEQLKKEIETLKSNQSVAAQRVTRMLETLRQLEESK